LVAVKKSGNLVFKSLAFAATHMNEKTLLILKILLLCSACAIVAAAVIHVLEEWLGWL
jgi:hypothetical protein